MSDAAEKRKEHRAKQAGPKARGKKAKEARKAGVSDSDRKKNPKVRPVLWQQSIVSLYVANSPLLNVFLRQAFIFNSANAARKAKQRNADMYVVFSLARLPPLFL